MVLGWGSNTSVRESIRKSKPETAFFIPGPSGRLEARLLQIQDSTTLGIICHPHPLYEGTMHNKVVTTVARAWRDLGVSSLRFNFRGVGQSEGAYGETSGEIEDLGAVLDWLKQALNPSSLWLAGFSFGAYIAFAVTKTNSVAHLLSIAPPVTRFPFEHTEAILENTAWGLIQGDQDEVVDPQAVLAWHHALSRAPRLILLRGASHFFHGQLLVLAEAIKQLAPQPLS